MTSQAEQQEAVVQQLAELLYDTMEWLDPSESGKWETLDESAKNVFAMSVERLLVYRELVEKFYALEDKSQRTEHGTITVTLPDFERTTPTPWPGQTFPTTPFLNEHP